MGRRRTTDRDLRVIAYIRVSKGREEMISPAIQRRHCEQAAALAGLEIIDWYEDLNRSGREFGKRQVADAIRRVNAGEAGGVMVWKISRWGRNMLDSLLNLKELQEAGGVIYSATEPVGEMDSPMGRFGINQMLAVAELQSDQIGESWKDSHEHRRENGLPNNGKPRFGYIYDKPAKKFSVDPVTGPWLAKAYQQFVAGKPLSRIALEMDEAAIRGTGGGRLSNTSLMFILDSGFGAGKVVVNARRGRQGSTQEPQFYVPGAHPAVISEELWQAYQRRRAQERAPRDAAPVHRLTGLVRCGSCERRMFRVRNAAGTFSWVCRNGRHNSTKPCPRQANLVESKLEAAVWEWIVEQARGNPADVVARAAEQDAARADVERLETQIKDRHRRLANLVTMRAEGEISGEEFRERRKAWDAELVQLDGHLADARSAIQVIRVPRPQRFEAVLVMWSDPDIDVGIVNTALGKVIRRVVVHPKAAGGQRALVEPAYADA